MLLWNETDKELYKLFDPEEVNNKKKKMWQTLANAEWELAASWSHIYLISSENVVRSNKYGTSADFNIFVSHLFHWSLSASTRCICVDAGDADLLFLGIYISAFSYANCPRETTDIAESETTEESRSGAVFANILCYIWTLKKQLHKK